MQQSESVVGKISLPCVIIIRAVRNTYTCSGNTRYTDLPQVTENIQRNCVLTNCVRRSRGGLVNNTGLVAKKFKFALNCQIFPPKQISS